MARPSKLSPDQWREVERRSAEGEGARSLAKAFGIDEAAIRRRVNPQTPQVRSYAKRLAEVQADIATLPISQQHLAVSLADDLRQISLSLAGAAKFGSATAHRLAGIAHDNVLRVDDASPLAESMDALKNVAALTRMSNDAAATGLNLLSANKETVTRLQTQEAPELLAPERPKLSRDDWLKTHGLA